MALIKINRLKIIFDEKQKAYISFKVPFALDVH
jgi:hypothetical protein